MDKRTVSQMSSKELNKMMQDAYLKAIKKNYGSIKNYEKYLYSNNEFLKWINQQLS